MVWAEPPSVTLTHLTFVNSGVIYILCSYGKRVSGQKICSRVRVEKQWTIFPLDFGGLCLESPICAKCHCSAEIWVSWTPGEQKVQLKVYKMHYLNHKRREKILERVWQCQTFQWQITSHVPNEQGERKSFHLVSVRKGKSSTTRVRIKNC